MKTYLERFQARKISELLEVFGGVVIQGAKATGKSTLGRYFAKSSVRLDADPRLAEMANENPSLIMGGAIPRLIDEWQLAPNIWNAVRHEIDDRNDTGQFLLTGSATPSDDITRHSGAGRLGRITLRTMTLAEMGESTKQVNFADLFSEKHKLKISGYGGADIKKYAMLAATGGWPAMLGKSEKNALAFSGGYIDEISRVSIPDINDTADPVRMLALLRAIARNISTECSIAKLAIEAQIDSGSMSDKTVRKYIDLLERIFVIEELPAWNVKIRSNVRQRVSPKWHLIDTSLGAAALGLSSARLLVDLETFGLYFESMALRDLRVYASLFDANVFHYRDETGLEVDAIAENRQGEWAAFEIKLGGEKYVKEGITHLKLLAKKVSDARKSQMKSLNVITGGNISYTDNDTGVNVISLGHLFV